MPLIDVIKGLACLAIAGHHFAIYGPMPDGARWVGMGLVPQARWHRWPCSTASLCGWLTSS